MGYLLVRFALSIWAIFYLLYVVQLQRSWNSISIIWCFLTKTSKIQNFSLNYLIIKNKIKRYNRALFKCQISQSKILSWTISSSQFYHVSQFCINPTYSLLYLFFWFGSSWSSSDQFICYLFANVSLISY